MCFCCFLSITQYSNVYTATPDVTELSESKELQEECVKFVASQGKMPHLSVFLCIYMYIHMLSCSELLCQKGSELQWKSTELVP